MRPKDAFFLETPWHHVSNRDLLWVEDYRGIPGLVMQNACFYKVPRAIRAMEKKGLKRQTGIIFEDIQALVDEGNREKFEKRIREDKSLHWFHVISAKYILQTGQLNMIDLVHPGHFEKPRLAGEFNYEPWIEESKQNNQYGLFLGACLGGNVDLVRELFFIVKNKAERYQSMTWCPGHTIVKTGMEQACCRGHAEVVGVLLHEDFSRKELRSYLFMAITHGHLKIVQLLLSHYSPTNWVLQKGLRKARRCEYSEIMNLVSERVRQQEQR